MIGLALHLAARAVDAAREAVSVPRLRAALTRQHEELQRQWAAVSELQGALERERADGDKLRASVCALWTDRDKAQRERDKARAELAELRARALRLKTAWTAYMTPGAPVTGWAWKEVLQSVDELIATAEEGAPRA